MRKTLKRETAILLILALVCMSIFALVGDDPALVSARAGIVTALAIPILGFAAAAFGMDWVAKQTNIGGPPASSVPPEYPPDIVPPEGWNER